MAVAVKNSPETTPQSTLDRLAVGSLVGAVYVLGSLIGVFYLVPALWTAALTPALDPVMGTFVDVALRIMAMVAAGAVAIFVGVRLLGSDPPHGLRAGIFAGLLAILVVGWLTWAVGMIVEKVVEGMVGIVVTLVVGLSLLALVSQLFFRSGFKRGLMGLEDQGWFTAAAYKRSQGQKVRRGTILGILILAFAGIYTMLSHQSLGTYTDWDLTIPFTPATIVTPGDTPDAEWDREKIAERVEQVKEASPDEARRLWLLRPLAKGEVVNKFELQERNKELEKYVKVLDPGDPNESKLQKGQIIIKGDKDGNEDGFVKESERLEKLNVKRPTSTAAAPATGTLPALVLLPDVKYTMPLLLALATVWLGYRIVNYPVFADFLIATEAELNKVSWTTRRRLVQGTIVVLVTVLLLTFFLLVVDVLWWRILSWKPIGVLQVNPQQESGQVEDDAQQIPY